MGSVSLAQAQLVEGASGRGEAQISPRRQSVVAGIPEERFGGEQEERIAGRRRIAGLSPADIAQRQAEVATLGVARPSCRKSDQEEGIDGR